MMDELQNVILQTPIEIALQIDESGHTTARALYEFLEMPTQNFARWAKTNIEGNEYYEKNSDWWGFFTMKSGNECKDYRLTTDFAKHLCMESHSAKGKIARQYFIKVEDKAKEMVINRSQLSSQLQFSYSLLEEQARMELEQKRQAAQIAKVEQTVDNMKEIFTQPIGDWKAEINSMVREISIKSGIDYETLYSQLYGELEATAHCSLKRLQENKKVRMERSGNTKTAIKTGTTKIAIVYEKPQLKAIFENIVKKYAMKYCA